MFRLIHQMSCLRSVNLSCNMISQPLEPEQEYPPSSLDTLNLNYNCLSSQGSQSLFDSPAFPRLTHLLLIHNAIKIPVMTNRLTSLQSLLLCANQVNCQGSQLIFMASGLDSLRLLNLCNNRIQEVVNHGVKISCFDSLVSLDLSHNVVDEQGSK